jgi:sRNA-binding carbon storage regulator CsrA
MVRLFAWRTPCRRTSGGKGDQPHVVVTAGIIAWGECVVKGILVEVVEFRSCITAVAIKGTSVRLGITAPREMPVDRQALRESRIAERRSRKPVNEVV